MRGATFYQLHLLLDKHAGEQLELVDMLAERVQTLGGVAVGDPRHVAEITIIPRPPDGAEEVPAMLSRLLEAHEPILIDAHDAAAKAAEMGDDGTNDLLVSNVIRTANCRRSSWLSTSWTPRSSGPDYPQGSGRGTNQSAAGAPTAAEQGPAGDTGRR